MDSTSGFKTRPHLVVFDVNETLSDLSPIGDLFSELGGPPGTAALWFAGLLRDGFALTAIGENPAFGDLASGSLRTNLELVLGEPSDEAVTRIMEVFTRLDTHPDVKSGLPMLGELDLRMVTLSNGSASIATGLLDRAGLAHLFDDVLSVSDSDLWKPASAAYRYALEKHEVEPSDALMVAVHPWDLAGAAAVGMQTAWINRSGGSYPDYFPIPDWQGRSLVDLASHVGHMPPPT